MREKYDYDKKLVMRIGKLCLEAAYQTENIGDKCHWFQKARELSESCLTPTGNWYFMCSSTISRALLSITAIQIYQRYKKGINQYFCDRNSYLPNGSYNHWNLVQIFIMEEFYDYKILEEFRPDLEVVYSHLDQIIKKGNGWKSHGQKLARIKCMLSFQVNDVIATFETALYFAKTPNDRLLGRQCFGRFHEILWEQGFGRIGFHLHKAIAYYKEAVEIFETESQCKKPITAYKSLRRLNVI
ncbi:hypothetical protein EB796_024150 [Bugula neritina]|uniref:Uncharacterized protein n=1 Tax=Bugula neritina TaxID=10212 RepID=A0A7J7IUP2_BUGNE|nr:hypothetical protein EB796_024150 [Bugula neritina]